MSSLSSVRLTVPKAANKEVMRRRLIDRMRDSHEQFAFIHAGAGYGKTTLLSQISRCSENVIWFSLAGENDVFSFINTLCEAIQQSFPEYTFISSEFLPFMEKDNFITILVNAFISSLEKLSAEMLLILDDIHTIKSSSIKEMITCFMKFAPDTIRLYLGSREAPWRRLAPFILRGRMLVINKDELAFNREEMKQVLGSEDEEAFQKTEGWPLAVGLIRILLDSGVSIDEVSLKDNESLHSYLFCECIRLQPPETVDFLKASACFETLDAAMMDAVLGREDSCRLLDSFVKQNLFTSKTDSGCYRYHALFQKCLLRGTSSAERLQLRQKAEQYYWNKEDYVRAADYAVRLQDKEMIRRIIVVCYKQLISTGKFNELGRWFEILGEDLPDDEPEIYVAKGALLSYIGNFIEAEKCLDAAIPLLNQSNRELYREAMVHKARVLRNFVSFEESNQLLDTLLAQLDGCPPETIYFMAIEKLYNLCWISRLEEAYSLTMQMIEWCARAGCLKVKAWFERYLSAVSFFRGNMKECIYYYEKSLELPADEQEYLDLHGISIYAAKAYQMMGYRERSLALLDQALQKMRNRGQYEEFWSGYLFAAEIHFQNAAIDRSNGENASYETTIKYFRLANEYAPLYRKTEFQMRWAEIQRITYGLMIGSSPTEAMLDKIALDFDECSDYLKCIVLARMMGYFGASHDLNRAVDCAKRCVEIGEKAGMLLHPAVAYGILARSAVAKGDYESACGYVKQYLRLCADNGIYEYFRARKDYDPILEFAVNNGIEPETTGEFMRMIGLHRKKAYIRTFGGFGVFSYQDRTSPIKMRTKKERELFAFLLDAGEQGATKEQIFDAIWSESESDNVKRLIGVNLAQIKRDLVGLEIENLIICREKRYSVCRDDIECDFEQFEEAARRRGNKTEGEETNHLLSLYAGDYLSDFEALWAIPKRIKYRKIYEDSIQRK